MRFRDLAREHEANARCARFVVKNGTNRFAVSETPWLIRLYDQHERAACAGPADRDAATGPALASTAFLIRLISN